MASRDESGQVSPAPIGRGWLRFIGFLLGLAVLIALFDLIGFDTVTEPLSKVGWGFFLIVGLNGLRHYLRALNLYIAVPRAERTFRIRNAFAARLAGEAINTVAIAGPVLGDATKAAMLNRKIPLEHSATAVIIDEILYYVSSLMMILAGAIVVLYKVGTGGTLINIVLALLILLSVLVFAGLLLTIRYEAMPVTWLITRIGHLRFCPRALKRRSEAISNVEINVLKFYDQRPRAFIFLTGIILLSHALSVTEAYAALAMLGFGLSAITAFMVESLTKAVNFIFFLIPGTVGAYEGGSSMILVMLGYSAGGGVALALLRRGAIIFWTLAGGAILLWRGVKTGTDRIETLDTDKID